MAGAAESKRDAECTGYRVDDLIIDIGRQRVMRGDQEIPLPQLSFEFFLALARAAPNVVTFDQLMERVWAGLVVSPETVSQRVKLVRDALGDDSQAPRYIAGVRGRGYRMQAQVVPLPEPTPLPQVVPEKPPEPPRSQGVVAEATGLALRWRRFVLAGAVLLLGGAVVFIVQLLRDRADSATSAPNEAPTASAASPKTVAVLPLIDISPGGGHEYLGDGLAEELTDRLVRVPGLRVAARTSSFSFKNQPADVRKIAQSLGVRYVLEGSVRREGERLRVTAQLIDAESGFHLWSQSYDRTWKDLLDIQDELARSIVERLEPVLTSSVASRVGQAPTASIEAFDLYFAGISKLRQPTNRARLQETEKLFLQALRADPDFVRAHAGLCQAYTIEYTKWRDTAVAAKAEAACRQALSSEDSSLREVETALASLYSESGRGSEALAVFQNAVNKDPTDPDAYLGLARAYEGLGRTGEADVAYRSAISAEPSYWLAHQMRGNFLFQNGRVEDALTHFRKVTELAPGSAVAFANMGGALQMVGNFDGAVMAFERSLALEPTSYAYSNMGSAYYFSGRLADAEKMYLKATEVAAADHRVWGNLADALYQMEGRRTDAVKVYQRAIALATGATNQNSTDADALAHLAYYYARVGDAARAQEHIARAMRLAPQLVYVQYYAALIALQDGRSDAALSALKRAVELGYPVQLVRAGPEFTKLKNDERFLRLIASTNRREAG